MRHVKLGFGVVAASCALAIAATPALAHEFTASKAGTLKGVTESEQVFKLGPFKITCERAVSKGKVVAGTTKTFALSTKMSHCWTAGTIGNKQFEIVTRFATPLAVEYHAGGGVETGSETGEEEGRAVLAGGEVEIRVSAGKKFKCSIFWPEQTIPFKAEKNPEGEFTAATFANAVEPKPISKKFPDGFQHSIVITHAFKSIKYEFEGEPCEEWGKEETSEGGNGQFHGTLPVYLAAGNFEYS